MVEKEENELTGFDERPLVVNLADKLEVGVTKLALKPVATEDGVVDVEKVVVVPVMVDGPEGREALPISCCSCRSSCCSS